jgi:DNA repair photolyase
MRRDKIMGKTTITTGTKEWADSNVNCVDGCAHDCRYCYAKKMAIRFGRKTNENWHEMQAREKDVNKSYRKRPGRIMFPTSHDIIPTDPSFESCMTVLGKLLRAGNEVLVTTKPHMLAVLRICQEFQQYKSQIQFRFTITSCLDDVLLAWEPGAPSFEERLKALQYAFTDGFKTSISCEPALDSIAGIHEIYETAKPYVTESFWIGTMNYCTPPVKLNPREVYDHFNGMPLIRFKDTITKALGINVATKPAAGLKPLEAF